jgi:hypothetical protein
MLQYPKSLMAALGALSGAPWTISAVSDMFTWVYHLGSQHAWDVVIRIDNDIILTV